MSLFHHHRPTLFHMALGVRLINYISFIVYFNERLGLGLDEWNVHKNLFITYWSVAILGWNRQYVCFPQVITHVMFCRSAPTSPSQVGVSGLVTPEELSREPTPDLFTGEDPDQVTEFTHNLTLSPRLLCEEQAWIQDLIIYINQTSIKSARVVPE